MSDKLAFYRSYISLFMSDIGAMLTTVPIVRLALGPAGNGLLLAATAAAIRRINIMSIRSLITT
jgi:hypothetical protein